MRRTCLLFLCFALAACTSRTQAPYVAMDSETGPQVQVLTVSTRANNDAGNMSGRRANAPRYLNSTVSIPPNHKPGDIELRYNRPDPNKHFVIAKETELDGEAALAKSLRAALAAKPAKDREITLFIHGYNSSYTDGLFRVAQLKNDLQVPGVMMHFSWPSTANPLGYSHDRDSVLYARDALEDLLKLIRKTTDAPVLLVAHSMGSFLAMETLRQIEIGTPGWSKSALSGVVLIAPDISVDVFLKQSERFKALPDPFAIFTSSKDPALRLSAALNGVTERLGNLQDAQAVAELPVTILDVTSFSKRGVDRHFVAGTSPALISLLGKSQDLESAFNGANASSTDLFSASAISVRRATRLILSPNLIAAN